MVVHYFLKASNQVVGPFKKDDVIEGIKTKKLHLLDSIFDNGKGEWVQIIHHPDFATLQETLGSETSLADNFSSDSVVFEDSVTSIYPTSLNVQEGKTGQVNNDHIQDFITNYWYEKSSPDKAYNFLDILVLLKQNTFSEATVVSKSPEGPWKAIIDWPDFSVEAISEFQKSSNLQMPDVVVRRKSPRFSCSQVFIFCIKNNLFKAFCSDVSKTGLSFLAREEVGSLGDECFIRLSDSLNEKAFDLKSQIVSMRKLSVTGTESVFVRYGLKFNKMTLAGKDRLDKLLISNDSVKGQ